MTSQTPLEHVRAYSATAPDSGLAPWNYQPRQPRPDDVVIQILYCGVCHTDIHFVENDWGITQYPVVPGHEIIGRVTSTGPEVSRLQPGDIVGVGCLVDACRSCDCCHAGLEQYCTGGAVWTYNGIDRHDGKPPMEVTPNRSLSAIASSPRSPLPSTRPRPLPCSVPVSPPIRRCAM